MTAENTLFALVGLWGAMMVVMMLPSALPALALFHQVSRRHQPERVGISLSFAVAYGSVWLLFSLVMAWIQWQVRQLASTEDMLALTSFVFFLAAGYQFSSWKRICLNNCRSPFGFLLNEWRQGYLGAGRMGMRYGLYCLGCCWALMVLMLGIGVMSLSGMLVITVMITVERLLPVSSVLLTRINGSLLLAWAGFWLLGVYHGD